MKVILTTDYLVEVDGYNHTLMQRTYDKHKQPTENFRPIGYFGSMKAAIQKALNLELVTNNRDATLVFEDYLKQLDAVTTRFEEVYNRVKK